MCTVPGWWGCFGTRLEYMFEETSGAAVADEAESPVSAPSPVPAGAGASGSASAVGVVASVVGLFGEGPVDLPEAVLVDLLDALEAVKSAAGAYQVRAAVALRGRIIERERQAGLAEAELGASAGAQLALARRQAPFHGGRWMGFSRALVEEMPHTLAAFAGGRISEEKAMLMVRETACLAVEDRRTVDEALMADPATTQGVGHRRLVGMARQWAQKLDARAVVRRARKAVGDRHVGVRPGSDTMGILTGVLPMAQAVGVYKALAQAADSAAGGGDQRSRGQVMADTLVERVTGQANAGDIRVEVQLVMTDRTLFQGDAEPAYLQGYGVLPAQIARDLIRQATDRHATTDRHAVAPGAPAPGGPDGPDGPGGQATGPGLPAEGLEPGGSDGPDGADGLVGDWQDRELVWLRRLYTAPGSGALVGLDTRARFFPEGLRRFIELRDQVCARPWCEAPIRQRDHILAWAAGGKTTAGNGAGLCISCNQSKEAPGWHSRPVPGQRHTIETTTPTGHSYRSHAPALPGNNP